MAQSAASGWSRRSPPGRMSQPFSDEPQPTKADGDATDLETLYMRVRDQPCSVVQIRRDDRGADQRPLRTKQAIIDRELQRVYDARTLNDIHAALEESINNLRQLDVFEQIEALLDSEPEGVPDACSVVMRLKELNWYRLHGGTFMQGGEGSVEAGVELRNLTGAADHWQLAAEYGHLSSNNFSAEWRQPRIGGLPVTPEVRVYQAFRNHQLASSFTEGMRALNLGLSSADGSQSLLYEYGWRRLSDPTMAASRAVRSQAGDYLKASLRYRLALDRRDSPLLQTSGWAVASSTELGGLAPGSTLHYIRQHTQLDWATPLSTTSQGPLAFHLSLAAGLLVPLAPPGTGARIPWEQPTSLPERFFVGGIDSLRGFEPRGGAGPSDARRAARPEGGGGGSGGGAVLRDSLGGDLFGTLFAAVACQLPGRLGDLGFHTHLFVNGGSSVLLSGGGGGRSSTSGGGGGETSGFGELLTQRVRQLGQSVRWSTGVGLVAPLPFGRFEANYVWVLTSQEHDRFRSGLQWGFAGSGL